MLAIVATLSASAAETQSGSVRGRVVDELGRPIGGAQIAIATARAAAATGADGRYLLVGIPTGTVEVSAALQGAERSTRSVTVIASDTVVADFVLLPVVEQWVAFGAVGTPLPADSIRKAVPDSAIVRARQVTVAIRRPVALEELRIALFDDLTLNVLVDRVSTFGASGFTARGTVTTASGRSRGIAALTSDGVTLTASLRIGNRLYLIRPQTRGVHLVLEVEPGRLPAAREPGYAMMRAADPPPPPPGPPDTPDWEIPEFFRPPFDYFPVPLTRFELGPLLPFPARNICSDSYNLGLGRRAEIRLLLAYTVATEIVAPGIELMVRNAVTELDAVLRDSGVEVDLTVVGVERTTLSEPSLTNDLVLQFVSTAPSSEHLRLRELQRTLAADILGVIVSAEVMGNASIPMLHPHRAFADSAIFATNWVNMEGRLSLAHEFGHVMGGDHLRVAGMTAAPWEFNYAFAHECRGCASAPNGWPNWVTLMGIDETGVTARLPRFSNPDATWFGAATGLALLSAAPADHRLAFQRALSTAASFRVTQTWFTSTYAAAPWEERRVERLTYREVILADFDGDRMLDALRVNPTTGQWDWVPRTEGEWQLRNPPDASRAIPIADVLVGRFDPIPGDDVLWIDRATKTWKLSSGGATAWTTYGPDASLDVPTADLAVADFDGDGVDDVFRSDAVTGTWTAALGAKLPWTALGPAGDPARRYQRSELAFGDFDGDGLSDVFRSDALKGEWFYVRDGIGDWERLNGPSASLRYPTAMLAIGRFTPDAQADVLATTGLQWIVSNGGREDFQTRRASCHRIWDLRFHDIDGDGMLDALRLGQRP